MRELSPSSSSTVVRHAGTSGHENNNDEDFEGLWGGRRNARSPSRNDEERKGIDFNAEAKDPMAWVALLST